MLIISIFRCKWIREAKITVGWKINGQKEGNTWSTLFHMLTLWLTFGTRIWLTVTSLEISQFSRRKRHKQIITVQCERATRGGCVTVRAQKRESEGLTGKEGWREQWVGNHSLKFSKNFTGHVVFEYLSCCPYLGLTVCNKSHLSDIKLLHSPSPKYKATPHLC